MPPSSRREVFFATCAPGLEPVLHEEAKGLRLAKVERQVGGVFFEGAMRDAWRANLHFRTAVRILWRLDRFEAADEAGLYRGIQRLDWSQYLRSDMTLAVTAQTSQSRLDHSLFVAQRTKDAIVDQFLDRTGSRPSVDKEHPDCSVHVHLFRDRCTVSLDTSGDSLHKRGWRTYQGRAPLAETLAAAIVLQSGWDRRAPLLDPFCGSGTILIEAGLIASGAPSGMFRERFAFESFLDHDRSAWQRLRSEALAAMRPPKRLRLLGVDHDPETIRGARDNIVAAGLEGLVEVSVGSALGMEFKRGWNATVVTNPPYGERVGSTEKLRGLYTQFGNKLRGEGGGYRYSILGGNPTLLELLGVKLADGLPLRNGAIECQLLRGEVPAE